MGSFTRIVHPDTGAELQIKIGYDICDWYNLGDKIPWTANPNCPGKHIDGVYRSSSFDEPDYYVVIKNCIIVAVENIISDENQYTNLMQKYNIQSPDSSIWTGEQWQESRQLDEVIRSQLPTTEAVGLCEGEKSRLL